MGVSKKLEKNLKSPDPAKRRAAVEALEGGDERAIYPLIKALRDSHPGVQDAAMRSLISIGGEVGAWMVLPLLRDEALLRNTAMVILKEIGRDAVPLLPPLLKDKDDDVRKFAIELISDAGARELSGPLCERLTDDTNPNVRAAAAKALGALDCREALPLLIAALADIEWVRFSVLEALACLRDEETVERILALLSDPSPATRRAAIETLGAIGSPGAGDALLRHLESCEPSEKAVVLTSLVRIGVPLTEPRFSQDLLAIFVGNDEWEDRLVALRGLVGTADGEALRAVLDVAGSLDETKPDEEETLKAIRALLLECGRPETLPPLLADPDLRFRGKTILAEVIGEFRIPEAVPNLSARLQDDVRDVRRAAAWALGRIGNDGSFAALLAAIGDTDSHVRKEVIAGLGASPRKEAFEPLLTAIRAEKYDDVAAEAMRALSAIDPEAFSEAGAGLEGHTRELFEAFQRGELDLPVEENPGEEWWT